MKSKIINKKVFIDKIRQYNHLAHYLRDSRFFGLFAKLPKYNMMYTEMDAISKSVISNSKELDVNSLATAEKKTKKILQDLKESPPYKIWQAMNKAKHLLLVGPKRIIRIDNRLWPDYLPLVSIVIPCFNYGKYIDDAVESVLSQSFKRLEIIIVNDGSNDKETLKVLDRLRKSYTVLDQTNKGLAAARNAGIKFAKGKYIICLDSDDKLKKDYIKLCVGEMEKHNLDVCYTDYQEFGDSSKKWKTGDFNIEMLIHSNTVLVSACFKKTIWSKVKGYDQQMKFQGYEDWNFWLSIAKNGGIGKRIPQTQFLYRKHGKSMIDGAQDHHAALFSYLKSKHSELFSNPFALSLAKRRQNKEYIVTNKTINLK